MVKHDHERPSATSTPPIAEVWRRGWDSNPRCACTHNGFRDRPDRPLWHPSAGSGGILLPPQVVRGDHIAPNAQRAKPCRETLCGALRENATGFLDSLPVPRILPRKWPGAA